MVLKLGFLANNYVFLVKWEKLTTTWGVLPIR